jgi:hypothetical protein
LVSRQLDLLLTHTYRSSSLTFARMAHSDIEKLPASPDTLCDPGSVEAVGKEEDIEANFDRQSTRSGHSEQSTIADNDDPRNIDEVLARTITPKRPIVRVPRSQRRGLLARFAVIAEVTHPYDYKNRTKWFITFIVAVAAAAAPVGSAIILRKLGAAGSWTEHPIDRTSSLTGGCRTESSYRCHNHQFVRGVVYVVNGHLPVVVVGILGNAGSSDDLSYVFCNVHSVLGPECRRSFHIDAHSSPALCWWRRCVCSGGRCWDNCRHLGDSRTRKSDGDLLSGTLVWAFTGPHNWWHPRRSVQLASDPMGSRDLWG